MIIRLFDFLRTHALIRWFSLAAVTLLLAALAAHLSYKEDISDFLPLGTENREALSVYQDISGANRLMVLFDNPNDADKTTQAIDLFCEKVAARDSLGWADDLTALFDMEKLSEVTDFVYQNIPYFLTEVDYAHMDSLLAQPNYIPDQLAADHQLLMFPSGGLLSANIGRDPLNLFTPVVSKLQRSQSQLRFEMYDGYIFTPDMKKAIVMLTTPFGSSETEQNTKLISLLNQSVADMQQDYPEMKAHVMGAPQIAVGNSSQIKKDSMLAVFIAIVLIFALLYYSFRSLRNMSLIGLSIGWGALFALGGMALFHDSVSIIVIGISSVILGIAVNYPLHLVAHVGHKPDVRTALREIVVPLLVGNVTTVGAFLALVPLQSTALRDLGLFASLLLVGTILFVLTYLPHAIKKQPQQGNQRLLTRIAGIRLESNRWVVWAVALLTIVFAWFSFDTEFDANMANINYMTQQQRDDMEYFQKLMAADTVSHAQTVYVVSSANDFDAALAKSEQQQQRIDSLAAAGTVSSHSGVAQFLSSKVEQQHRLSRWQRFVADHRQQLSEQLRAQAAAKGFNPDAFSDFEEILQSRYTPQNIGYFATLTQLVFSGNLSHDDKAKRYSVVDILQVSEQDTERVKSLFKGSFDPTSMNSALANSLSNDFNYIGWACSFIVFFFLWFSFGRIELALLSFLPMAVSWVWILGLMAILGIKFNIVNIILATFIFGQGDDYTIFMTEGSSYEYAYRKPMLASYKNSIILSALIMFIGIGSLIVARHPALLSLAQLTILGMFSVVLMAYLLPPLVFKWITMQGNQYRKRPLTLSSVLRTWVSGIWWFIQLASTYVLGFFLFVIGKRNLRTRELFHRYVSAYYRVDLELIPLVKHKIINPHHEDFSKPCIVVCNHQSMLDPMCLMALSHKILIVANQRSSYNPIIKKVFKWLDFYTVTDNFANDLDIFRKHIEEGYSIAIFPEAERNPNSSILRFHKGPFYLAQQLKLDIVPIIIHGINDLMPIHSFACNQGSISVFVDERAKYGDPKWGETYRETTRLMRQYYKQRYADITRKLENAEHFGRLVKDRYLYKGIDVSATVARRLKKTNNYAQWVDTLQPCRRVVITHSGYGEFALLMALVHPDVQVTAVEADELNRRLAFYSAEGLVKNLTIAAPEDLANNEGQPDADTITFDFEQIINNNAS